MRVLSCITLLCAVAGAQGRGGIDEKKIEQLLQALFQSGKTEQIVKLLESGLEHGVTGSHDQARSFCALAARNAGNLDISESRSCEKLIGIVLGVGKGAADQSPQDADALYAYAEALLFKARLNLYMDGRSDEQLWQKIVTQLEEIYKLDPEEGRPLARAVEILIEAARNREAGRDALLERADEVCLQARRAHPLSKHILIAAARMDLAKAEALLPGDRREAKKAVERCFETLGLDEESRSPDMELATMYNDAVTFAFDHRKKLRLNADYLMESHTTKQDLLKFSIPVSTRWRFDRRSGDLGRIWQYDQTGRLIRTIGFFDYRWDTLYDGVGGDNLKGLIKSDLMDARQEFVQITRSRDLVKSRFNRRIRKAYSYVVSGIDEDGDFGRIRSFYFKGKEHMVTLNVYIYEYVDVDPRKVGPETEAVLDSIEEVD